MSWREWLQDPQWRNGKWSGDPFDAIVVGSGYGGSVAALRLAQKGYRVLVLERGSEYLTGEFPNDFSMLPKFVRMNVPGEGVPLGRASGLVELHAGQGMMAVTGNGLGGTSLLNAGVLMKPDADVFAQAAWPAAIRHAQERLDDYFQLAQRALGAKPWHARLPDDATLPKTAALQRLAREIGREAEPVEATIDPQRCRSCGDCAAGCNVPGAKLSLDATYLRAALLTRRVQIVSQAEVYRFSHDGNRQDHRGWKVHVFATDAQQEFLATREVFSEGVGTARTLAAPMLFICAGTLGSTQLLQRSQAQAGGTLAFTPALGTHVSGNGDSLSWLVNEPERVGAVGGSHAPVSAAAAAADPHAGHAVGPTITASIDLRRRADGDRRLPPQLPLHERLLIEDGAVPRAIGPFFRELLATAGTLRQLDGWWFDRPRHPQAADEDPLAASAVAADHAQTLLTMGHDGSPARIVWLDGLDRSAPWLPQPELLGTYVEQQKLFDRFGRRHVHHPLWQAMPRDALKIMSGEKPPRTVVTVHPLGGCVMGDDPDCSVVTDRGQVWVHEPGRRALSPQAIEAPPLDPRAGVPRIPGFANEPQVYRGLYVLDGSIVPTSLGCNPLWTITALAERALEQVPSKGSAAPLQKPARGAQRTPQPQPRKDVKIAATLNEVLIGRNLPVTEGLARVFEGGTACARFEATFVTEDILHVMRARRHGMDLKATLAIGAHEGDAASLEYGSTDGSSFDALPAGRYSSGCALFWRCMAELAVLLACVLAPLLLPLPAWLWPGYAWAAFAQGPRGWFAAAALCWLVLLPLALLLPYPRTILSWLILRGWLDIRDYTRGNQQREGGLWFWALALLKQLVHASEKRVMRYRIPMRRTRPDGSSGAPLDVTLHASKTVMYRATPAELLAWLRRRCRGEPPQALRPTLWQQVMNARVVVVPGSDDELGCPLLSGVFEMGFENLTSSGLSSARRNVRPPIELGLGGDVTSGALALASYPLLFLRFALKTRLLDFRLPTYSAVPLRDQSPPPETCLRRAGQGELPADLHWIEVSRGDSNNDRGDESTVPLRLQLRRYARRDEQGRRIPPELSSGEWMGVPVARARSVLLLHAFGQSGLSFTVKTVAQNLAEHLYAHGYEVWVLEMRMSTRSGHATDPCSIDQIAEHDIAGAVRYIVERLGQELPCERPLQIAAFAQCIGSAALWMAALSGKLQHPKARTGRDGEVLSMLSHAMFSQVHPWVTGARDTQAKTWMPALLHGIWHRGYVPFAVRGAQDGIIMPFLDRVLASMPVPPEERRPFEGHDDAAATCRRIRFIEAPLFHHRNLNEATYGAMNRLFGDANLRLFTHARRFVDRELLVDEDGLNRYVTPENLRRNLAFPVQLLHGAHNELFDCTSATDSFTRLGATHARWQQLFCRDVHGQVGPLLIDGHGHVDVLIGKDARTTVFPHVREFFDACLRMPVHDRPAAAAPRWLARPPQVGPFVGWLRRDAAGQAWLRVSFGLDQRAELPPAGAPLAVVVRYRRLPMPGYTRLPLPAGTWKTFDAGRAKGGMVQRFAWADLPLPAAAEGVADWQVFSLHPASVGHGKLLPSPDPSDEQLDAYLAQLSVPAPQTIVPPLSDRGHGFDFARAGFHVPPVALQSLRAGSGLRFALACCRHPGFGIDRGRVDSTVAGFLAQRMQQPVAFGLLLGDQIYADATAGLLDPTSPLERYHERHEQAFDRPGLGQLLAAMPCYLTPDDHEWIEAFPEGAPLRKEAWPDRRPPSGYRRRLRAMFRSAGEALTAYQRLQSPSGPRPQPWYAFEHGCARFFVMDTRYSRRRNHPWIVSRQTLADLQAWLRAAPAEALNVMACGTVVLPGLHISSDPANPGPVDTWQFAERQRRELLALLVATSPGRFLLLAGDYHVSGAGYVRHGGRTVGAAVLAPPIYAPMPYANSTPDAVFLRERIPLPGHAGLLRYQPVAGGEIARGSAVATIEVQRTSSGGFEIDYARELRVWEAGEVVRKEARLVLEP